jgi:hypothetical protein
MPEDFGTHHRLSHAGLVHASNTRRAGRRTINPNRDQVIILKIRQLAEILQERPCRSRGRSPRFGERVADFAH